MAQRHRTGERQGKQWKHASLDLKMDAIRRCYYDGESIESVSRDIGYTPGEFHITPVKVTVESNTITYTVATDSVVLDKNDVEKGLYVVTEGSFSPKVIRKTGGCNPCTNCGKCSW